MNEHSLFIVALKENMFAEETFAERLAMYGDVSKDAHVLVSVPYGDETHDAFHLHTYTKRADGVLGRLALRRFIAKAIPSLSSRVNSQWIVIADGEENVVYADGLARAFHVPLDVAYDTVGQHATAPALLGAMTRASIIRVPSQRVVDDCSSRFPHAPVPTILSLSAVLVHDEEIISREQVDMSHIVGYATDQVSLLTLLSAWKHIVNRYPHLRLTVLCERPHGPFRETHAIAHINTAQVSDGVEVYDYEDRARVRKILSSASCFLHVASSLPYGRRLVEAYRAGIPIITTDVGVVGDMITGDNALICPIGDASCVAKQTLFMIDNPSIYASLLSQYRNISKHDRSAFIEVINAHWNSRHDEES